MFVEIRSAKQLIYLHNVKVIYSDKPLEVQNVEQIF